MKMLTAKSLLKKPDKIRIELPDGGGLYFIIQPSGARSWAYRYRYRGQSRKLTLGSYPIVPLTDTKDPKGRVLVKGARTLAGEAREIIDSGRDPAREKSATAEDGPV